MCQQAVQHLLLSKRTVQNLTILYCALVVSRVLNLAISGLLDRIAGGQWNLSQGSEEENPPSPHRGTISVSEICSFFVKLLLLFGLVFSGLLLSCFEIHSFVLWPGTWRFVCHYRPGGCFSLLVCVVFQGLLIVVCPPAQIVIHVCVACFKGFLRVALLYLLSNLDSGSFFDGHKTT